jgi:hypothetical protein
MPPSPPATSPSFLPICPTRLPARPRLPARRAPRTRPRAPHQAMPCANRTWERIEGVSRSLPYSDLLALTSSHMFFSVMN